MDIATLGLKIDATGAIRGVGEVEAKLQALESGAAKVGGVLRTAFLAGGAAVAGLSALIIKNTAEMDKATAQLDATLKSTKGAAGQTRDALLEAAAGFQKLSTFSDDAVMSAQALLLTFTNIKGDQFNAATQAILDMATAMGGDLKGATIQVGKALNDPILGVSALAKAGVQLTESQKALVEQMVNVGDVAGAQKVILGELATQFGGSAKAARDTMGGALTALKNAFGDLLEVPGIIQPITAALNELVSLLGDPAIKQAIADFVKSAIVSLAALGSAILELVRLASAGLGGIASAFGALSGENSPLNRFSKWAESLEIIALKTQDRLDGLAESVGSSSSSIRSATPTLNTHATALGAIANEANTAAVAVTKLTGEQENLYAWIRKLEKSGTTAPLQQVALPESSPLAVAALPPEGAQSSWTNFLGWLATEGGVTAESLGKSLTSSFDNIVTRGKASFGDLFNFLGGAGLGKEKGGVLLGFAANLAEMMLGGKARAKAAREAFEKEVNSIADGIENFSRSFRSALGAFQSDLERAANTYQDLSERVGNLLTITARRALDAAGGDVGAAISNLQRSNVNAVNNVAIAQLEAYRKATDDLTESYKAATTAAKAAQERRRADAREDNEVRRLRATGQNEAADRLAMEIRFGRELSEALREGLDIVSLMAAQSAEWAAFVQAGIDAQAEAERQRSYTIRSLDADILAASGDTAGAEVLRRQLERDKVLGDITDETIRLKYEELWALEDVNRAAKEAADALKLIEDQAKLAEDYEVRRLQAMGKNTEAEELRFKLTQQRELMQAQKDLALGLITQELYDTLVEILGLEATNFANRNAIAPASPLADGASDAGRQTSGTLGSFASAQVQDIDRVVGELTTIRIRMGQLVQYMARFTRGGGVVGAVNASLQTDTNYQQVVNGNLIVS